jgi:hypothetical protein
MLRQINYLIDVIIHNYSCFLLCFDKYIVFIHAPNAGYITSKVKYLM